MKLNEIIKKTIGEKINLDSNDIVAKERLVELIISLEKNKIKCIKENNLNYERFDWNLNYFKRDFKGKVREFNSKNKLHIPFGKYFLTCLREIKIQYDQLSESELQILFQATIKVTNNLADLEEGIKRTLKELKKYVSDSEVSDEDFLYFSKRYLMERKKASELNMDSDKIKGYDQEISDLFKLRKGEEILN